MTLLEIVQELSKQIGFPEPSLAVGSTDVSVKQIVAFLNHEGKELRSKFRWAELQKEHTFTLVTDQANYALPADFDQHLNNTQWDRTNFWPLIGPITPQRWQYEKSWITSVQPRSQFRLKGWELKQFYLNPTPASGDSGNTMAFEYSSLTWVRPVTWTESATFTASSYCSYDGNIYQTTSGGVTGSTAPTHTSGSTSDGGVTWTYSDAAYQEFVADTDVPILDSTLLLLGGRWRFLQQKGIQEWQFVKQEYDQRLKREEGRLRGSRRLSLVSPGFYDDRLISPGSVPDTGFGS